METDLMPNKTNEHVKRGSRQRKLQLFSKGEAKNTSDLTQLRINNQTSPSLDVYGFREEIERLTRREYLFLEIAKMHNLGGHLCPFF